MYEVYWGQETESASTRDEAIRLARQMSSETFNTVVVEDDRDCERLTYRNGDLIKYSYDTRKG